MSTHELILNKTDEEYTEDLNVGKLYHLLKVEHERCRQEIYDLKRKLELNEAMLREVQETGETVERSLNLQILEKEKMISEEKEKHRIITKEYEDTISDLETQLAKQTNEIQELRELVNQREESVYTIQIKDESANISLETNKLHSTIEQLETLLREEREKLERAEGTINQLQTRYEKLVIDTTDQLDQKSRALEAARAKLSASTEAAALKPDPTPNSQKGNSLFAEVEDRRQNMVDKMNALREKYMEVKRICKAQMTEIKMLKTERATLWREWKDYEDCTFPTNNELIQKYKHRIFDLENKLKCEIKRKDDAKELNSNDASFEYFQSLLESKKNETDELRIKIEDLSTQLMLQEDTKWNITKELQYWQYKASTLEAQIFALQDKLESDPTNSNELKYGKPTNEDTNDNGKRTVHEKNQITLNQELEKLDQQLPSIASLKTENVTLDHMDNLKGTLPNEPCKYKHAKHITLNEKKSSEKTVRFIENVSTIESNNVPLESTEKIHKYPVAYISIDSDDI